MNALRLVLVALFWMLAPAWASAGPPPMNPAAMSGTPRPDGNIPAGTVTVRCLGKAGFSAPQVGIEVMLAVRGPDGTTKSFTATTQEQGRATFSELAAYNGGTAMASVTLGGAKVTSQPIKLLPSMGTALLLVEGASAAKPPPPHGQAGGPDIPAPGTAFPLSGTAKGSLTVGTYDLAEKKPITGVEVTLSITPKEGEPTTRKGTTDTRGKFVFEGLLPPDVPEGATVQVEGTLRDALRQSNAFTMDATAGMAVVLAEGAENFQPPQSAPPPQQQQPQRSKLPGPRRSSQLPAGSVDVLLVDGNDQPVVGQAVVVIKRTASGISGRYTGKTGDDGRARIKGIDVQQDAGYVVETVFSSAPYQTSFFFMDKRGGVQAALRVFETTADPSVVRSAVQYDVDERENDMAQVVQIYEVMVQGEKAFWDPQLRVEAPEGAKGFTVLRPAEAHLDHEDKARFATLHGPIPPGELTNLSVAYLLPHSGTVDLEWSPPFDIVQGSVLVGPSLSLTAEGASPTDLDSPIPDKVVHTIPEVKRGTPFVFTLDGLKIRDPRYRMVGVGVAGALALFTLIALLTVPRRSPVQRLVGQKTALLKRLASTDEGAERDRVLRALDRVYRQIDALRKVDAPKPSKPTKSKDD